MDREHVALREVCSAFTRYDGSRGLHRIVLELLHGVSDYFKSSRLSYVEGRSRYSYILPAIDHMLRDNAAWRWDEVVDAAMELLLQFFNYLPDSTYQISDTPGMHPAERFCTSEENVVALTHYAQALARRHSKRSPQQAGYCFRLITTKVASDGLPSLPIQQEIKDTFMAACSRVPDDVWYQPEPATDDDDDASIVLPTNLSGGAMSSQLYVSLTTLSGPLTFPFSQLKCRRSLVQSRERNPSQTHRRAGLALKHSTWAALFHTGQAYHIENIDLIVYSFVPHLPLDVNVVLKNRIPDT